MTTAAHPSLETGRVYRTRELRSWGANAPRMAKRLVKEGALVPLAHGLFFHPRRGRFGTVPPDDAEILRAFLDGAPYLFTGPERWNALGLGTTAVFSAPLVYNTKRSGIFNFGGKRFVLRRVAFPANPPVEWFAIDLLENVERAGASRREIEESLQRATAHGLFSWERLLEMARSYGTRVTQALILNLKAAT